MENQHRKITGYRDLAQADIDLMNKIKAHAVATDLLIAEVGEHLDDQSNALTSGSEIKRIKDAEPRRWVAISKTDFQTGFMALTRAVAQPTTF